MTDTRQTRPPQGGRRWRFHLGHAVAYVLWLVKEVIAGSLRVARKALTPGTFATASIVRYDLRCERDLEVTWMASSITITPGTLVVGTAHGTATEPVTLYVHCVFDQDREEIVAGLREMEDRLLRMLRGPRWEEAA